MYHSYTLVTIFNWDKCGHSKENNLTFPSMIFNLGQRDTSLYLSETCVKK